MSKVFVKCDACLRVGGHLVVTVAQNCKVPDLSGLSDHIIVPAVYWSVYLQLLDPDSLRCRPSR
jgi:hypothetical protein